MTLSALNPKISVVLPVHNGGHYLGDAITSVLTQSLKDLEIIVVDDGSTDRTADILTGFTDPRLRVIHIPTNRGIVFALNCGIDASQAELIARMDADDICLPQRLERQADFLNGHPDVAICGSWTREIGARHNVRRLPRHPEQIRARMFFGGALDHPSVMMRRSFLKRHGLSYDERYRHAEDLDLFIRAGELGMIANVPEILLLYRVHDKQVSATQSKEQRNAYLTLLKRQLQTIIPEPGHMEAFHLNMIMGEVDAAERAKVERWLLRLERANEEIERYETSAFRRELFRRWFSMRAHLVSGRLRTLISFARSPLVL